MRSHPPASIWCGCVLYGLLLLLSAIYNPIVSSPPRPIPLELLSWLDRSVAPLRHPLVAVKARLLPHGAVVSSRDISLCRTSRLFSICEENLLWDERPRWVPLSFKPRGPLGRLNSFYMMRFNGVEYPTAPHTTPACGPLPHSPLWSHIHVLDEAQPHLTWMYRTYLGGP